MFQNLCRSSRSTSRMPVSLSEWRVRIGTYVPRMLQLHNIVRYLKQLLFLAILETLADGESNEDPSEKQEMDSTSDHQSSMDKTSSKPEKDDSSSRGCDEQETPTSDNNKTMPRKTSKKRKRRIHKESNASRRSSRSFMSFRCFMKSGASSLLRFMLLAFTAILLVRSGDVEVNPGPNENSPSGIDSLTILNIAGAIPDETKISLLGYHLGTASASIQMYLATNRMDGRVTSNGTRHMIEEWQERTGREEQHRRLRKALEMSNLRNVADMFLAADSSVIAASQGSSSEMPISAPIIPPQSQPMDYTNQQPYPSHVHYHPSHNTASHQYAASSSSQDQLPTIYQGIHHPYMTPFPVVPPSFGTQQDFTPSHQVGPEGSQFQTQRLQPNHPSSSYGQFSPHVMISDQLMAPAQQTMHSGACHHGELNTNPNTQRYNPTVSSQSQNAMSDHHLPQSDTWETLGQSVLSAPRNSQSRQLASSQMYTHCDAGISPNMEQQERMQIISSHMNVKGSMSISNLPPKSSGRNILRTTLVNPTSEQTVSGRRTSEQPHSTMFVNPSQLGTQSGTLHTAASTMSADQTQQNPSSSHPITSDLHGGYSYGTSRSDPPLKKRTIPDAPVQSKFRPTMESTSSSNASSTMLSGHTITHVPQNPSISSINCITDKQLERCIADIKHSYRVNLCQVPTSPLDLDSIVELKCIFTNLFLLKEDRNTKKKVPLKYEDLLTVDINEEPAKRIMIQGEAGVGKTTFCAKIAWDWVTGEHYQDYTLVAVVPLREAKNGKTVGQVLKTYLSDDNDVTSEQLDKYIRTNQDKVLTVFDGFDEFSLETLHGENEIVQILQGEKQKSSRVIVTTRPWKAHEIANGMNLKKQYAFVKIEGFKRKDVKTYVTKFYQDDKTSAATLLEFMEEGSLVTESMAPFPIFCSMLCHMWREVERREVIRKLQTFSQLFQEMIVHLKEHYISKDSKTFENSLVQDSNEKIDSHFENISKIAFNALLNDKLAFLEQEFESCAEDLHVACEVGLLTHELKISKRAHGAVRKVARQESTFSFPHKLFQEYTAAIHLQDLFSSTNVEFDRIMQSTILSKPTQYKYLLYFIGSFNKNICKDIIKRMIRGKISLDLIVEVAFEGHSEEAANVIEEMKQDELRSLRIEKGTSLHVISGYMFALKHLVSIHLEGIPHSKILSRNLAEKVCSLQSLTKIELVGCNVPVSFSEHLQLLAKDSMVETFLLYEVKLTKNSAINLAKCFCSLPNLKILYIKHLKADSLDDLFSALQSGASKSKVESLEVVDISVDGLQSLGASICALPCLRNLNIHAKFLHDESVAKITLRKNVGGSSSSEVISSSCQINITLKAEQVISFVSSLSSSQTSSVQVESLQIDDCDISESASQTLGASICAMTYVKDLKLSGELSDGFYSALIKGASSLKVESLQIDDRGESASQTLGASICAMPYLQHVKLSGNLSDGFYNVLREGASSLKVESLQIDDCDISESASQTLGSSICAMSFLKDVQLIGKLSDGFYSALSEGASSLKVESLQIHDRGISESASQTLGASICVMPCLKDVKLRGNLSDGFYSALSEGASSLKMKQMHLMGATLDSRHLSTLALLPDLKLLTLFDIKIDDRNHTEMDGSDPSSIHSSTSLTELNVDHDSFISLHRNGLMKRFPGIQKMTLAFHHRHTPFPQELSHNVTMPDVTDLFLHGNSTGGVARIDPLSLELFPNIINISLINIPVYIENANCTTILNSLRNNETLKTISIKDCYTDARLDSLVDEINAEGKMMVTVEHGKYIGLQHIFENL